MLLSSQEHKIWNKLCESIIDSDQKICYVAIVNSMGRLLESKDDSGVIGCLSGIQQDMFFMEYALRQMMRNEFDNEFGSVRFTYAEREKEALFSFPLDRLLVVVACPIDVDPKSVSKKIISIIDEFKIKLDK